MNRTYVYHANATSQPPLHFASAATRASALRKNTEPLRFTAQLTRRNTPHQIQAPQHTHSHRISSPSKITTRVNALGHEKKNTFQRHQAVARRHSTTSVFASASAPPRIAPTHRASHPSRRMYSHSVLPCFRVSAHPRSAPHASPESPCPPPRHHTRAQRQEIWPGALARVPKPNRPNRPQFS